MRIACVHIPQFALQCATRIDPSLRPSSDARPTIDDPAALVVVGPPTLAAPDSRSVLHPSTSLLKTAAPIVLACSRAAWALGARVGMSAAAARNLSPEIALVSADPQLERDTVRAIADVLLSLSPVVDVGGRVGPGGAHLAIYCEVPAKTRGTSFGDRLLERLESLGLTGRVGIADDRFTAWVAAWLGAFDAHAHDRAPQANPAGSPARHDETGVVSVPRGGSAAFLAPRPLSLLSISPEVQHMLEALGVRTLGEFASLPAPTVSSRGARFEADYQALARGESGNALRPYAPDAPIREEAVLNAESPSTASADRDPVHHAHQGLSAPAAVAILAERVAMRLAGRARCAARIDITIGGAAGERVTTISPVREGKGVLSSAEELADAIGAALGGDTSSQAWRMKVVVSGEALAGDTNADAMLDSLDALVTPTQRSLGLSVARSSGSAGSASSAYGPTSASAASTATMLQASRASRNDPNGPNAPNAPNGPNAPHASNARSAPIADGDVALSIALSTTGSSLDRVFGLTSPASSTFASERRDSHRRTRRGKQRRRAEVASMVQPRLFKL
ncbi:MAG: hypothetical protein M4D80_36530 [Myxococcota bacterium]|nr:hypothetical protein [Myxococcota bacterium]